ncbi:restriction endonuclease subunit S [Heyndrickxia sporothermodurans]|uniref:restriction endonuclease subunit S n=1 Tax=Heyndrickxia sporothermodurans TaxID=46224 RepID=UPI00147459A4|nr:restriction endonuclease subunit S [Heyndrickxia sporothermodurans]MBL5782262.1 restriction endonuclease subunit S [Heyndrickxia sporothermodurans]MBL5793619.1 restriction endonuclease subunit S [Heyndrickxia sporothermodurans]MBL5854621.1 restriction endonuclease subunit S [Heyndrickxia sporothermodurans]MBL5866724.1 restriction endonuclease subunit S [Heyndrickxia sporothermodurans]MBL7247476.1 restriction endonuclease subunit S [Heyndrickxia sporothermodurans]
MSTIALFRKKIMEQAIKGELSINKERVTDSAFDLLNKIQSKKEELIKNGKLKSSKPLPKVTVEEEPFSLPKGWIWARFGDATINRDGERIPLSKKEREIKEKIYDYYGASGIIDKVDSFLFETPLLLIGEDGANLISRSTPIAFIATGKYWVNNHAHVVDSYDLTVLKYLSLYINAINLEPYLTGSAQPKLNQAKLNMIVVALPPYSIMKELIDKVDSLNSLCDQWELEVRSQQKHIETLRNKVLNDALQGLLVPQNNEEESANVLLKKIKAKKEQLIKAKVIKKSKSLPPIEENEIPHKLPSGWIWVRIGDIAQINPRNAIDDDLEVGFVPMTLIEDGYSGKHTSETRKWSEIKKGFTHFQENDIAIAKITPCFENKKSAIMKDLANGYGAGTTELHIVRPFHDYVLVDYLMCLFKSNTFIEKGVQTYTGTAGQQRISKDFIENYVIGLPPIEEQHRIVEKVNTVWETINEIENNIVKAK